MSVREWVRVSVRRVCGGEGGVLAERSTGGRPREGAMTGVAGVAGGETRLAGEGGAGSEVGTEAGGESEREPGMEMGRERGSGAAGLRSGGLWDRMSGGGVGGDFGGVEGVWMVRM